MIFSRTPTPPQESPLLARAQPRAWDPLPQAQVYSVPRRFDLATLLTVSLAYSLLFAMLKAFDAS